MTIEAGVYDFPGRGYRRALVAVEGSHTSDSVQEALARAGYRGEVCAHLDMILDDRRTEGHSILVLETKDGRWDVVHALRGLGARIPILFLSGRFTPPLRDKALGALECLASPFTMDTFRRAVARVSQNDPTGPRGRPGVADPTSGAPREAGLDVRPDQFDPESRSK